MQGVREPRIVRGAGRRSDVEEAVTATLVGNAKTLQQFLIDNNRIATGRAVNSVEVHIIRQPKPGRTFRKSRKLLKQLGYKENQEDAAELNRRLDNLDVGLVKGEIRAAPHFRFALEGRGPGGRPPVAAILEWMRAKGIEPLYRHSPYLIARKIGEQGTDPPYWNQRITTQMTKFSTAKLITALKGPLSELLGKELANRIVTVANDPSLAGVMDAVYQKKGRKSGDWRRDIEDLKKVGTETAANWAKGKIQRGGSSFLKGFNEEQ